MRGRYYLWAGSDGVHLWAFDGEDGWKDTGWGVSVKYWKPKRGQKPTGVRLPRVRCHALCRADRRTQSASNHPPGVKEMARQWRRNQLAPSRKNDYQGDRFAEA